MFSKKPLAIAISAMLLAFATSASTSTSAFAARSDYGVDEFVLPAHGTWTDGITAERIVQEAFRAGGIELTKEENLLVRRLLDFSSIGTLNPQSIWSRFQEAYPEVLQAIKDRQARDEAAERAAEQQQLATPADAPIDQSQPAEDAAPREVPVFSNPTDQEATVHPIEDSAVQQPPSAMEQPAPSTIAETEQPDTNEITGEDPKEKVFPLDSSSIKVAEAVPEKRSNDMGLEGIAATIAENQVLMAGIGALPILVIALIAGFVITGSENYEPKSRIMKKLFRWRRRKSGSAEEMFDAHPYSEAGTKGELSSARKTKNALPDARN